MDELSAIMSEFLSVLKEKLVVAENVFNLWFDSFELIEFTDTRAVFSTPNKLKKSILSTKYINSIRDALEEVVGFSTKIEIYTVEELSTLEGIPEEEDDEIPRPAPEEDRDGKETIIAEFISGNADKPSPLDAYTFDNFVVGTTNTFAKAVCMAVAKEPTTYNPLFIHGNSGLGKTHLLYAVINYMKKNHPHLKIVYKKCETFLEELVDAIKTGFIAPFKEKYRECDVLLIDDIQFLAGKEATQEEFFHTFSVLYEHNKQIILTSDRPPKDIKPLSDRLLTRFEGGLIADVQPPNYELRIAIIKKKADDLELVIPQELIEYMGKVLCNNIRQIEGVLRKLHAISSFSSAEITKERIDEVISVVDPGNVPTDAMVERILLAVSKHYGISIEDMKSKKRTETIAGARHVAIYLIKKHTELTLTDIGGIFNRNHTTVMASVDRVDINIRTVTGYEREIKGIEKEIKR